jgi:gluconolactonase
MVVSVLIALGLFVQDMNSQGQLVVHDRQRFQRLVSPDAKVEKLAGGMKFTEGPVWVRAEGGKGHLIFSDIGSDKLMRWSDGTLGIARDPSHHANGNTLDRAGRLITCEHSARRVTVSDRGGAGAPVVLVDDFEGKRFNSPNDVVVRGDGSVWFTDPPYGLPKGQQRELEKNYVFRFDPKTKRLTIVADDFDMPNGLCFSPDERTLYVADSGRPHHIRAFDLTDDGKLTSGRVFCTLDAGAPDGIRCDEHGNVWSSAGDGAHVFAPDGELLGKILCPETPANLCFGGDDGKTLFMTARTSLYAIKTNVRGAAQ